MLTILSRYDDLNTPITAELVAKCDVAILRAVMACIAASTVLSPLESWEQLIAGGIKYKDIGLAYANAQLILKYSSKAVSDSLESLASQDAQIVPQRYEVQIIADSLVSWLSYTEA